LKISCLGTHNAESKTTRLPCFLIDGVLALDAGSLTSQLTIPQQRKIKAILLSHYHYDHIGSMPNFAFNEACNSCTACRVFATEETLKVLSSHCLNGIVYPEFTEKGNFLGRRTIKLIPITPLKEETIAGYKVKAIPVQHTPGAVGFEIISEDGKSVFYSGDTGSGLSSVWESVSPSLMIIDVTFPNELKSVARHSHHLCPEMLREELIEFHRIRGYYPEIAITHTSPQYESEIGIEVKKIAEELGITIRVAKEWDELTL
jgi:3',5'-cyclic-nucleotide phosphodiesterase